MNAMAAQGTVLPDQADKAGSDVSRPRILYLSAVADMKGGAERVLLDMLRSPFAQTMLAVPGRGALADRAAEAGVPVYFYELGNVRHIQRPVRPGAALQAARDALRLARQIGELARSTRADLVHANGLKVHVGACMARLLYGTRSVIHMHDVPFSRSERVVWNGLNLLSSHTIAASAICFPDHAGRSGHVSVVRQGTDAPAAREPRSLSPRPVIGYAGRFHAFKGTHLLLDWFAAAAEEFPQATLLLRGRADSEGAEYWAKLQSSLAPLVEQGRCRVDAWRPDHADPFEGIDILAAPSVHPEVGPRVIMEAMLRGIPAIGYPAGGAMDMIPHAGLGAHAAGPDEFRAALRRLLVPSNYSAVSAAALEHAQEHFGIERFQEDLARAHAAALQFRGPLPSRAAMRSSGKSRSPDPRQPGRNREVVP